MRKLMMVVAVASLAACSSTKPQSVAQPMPQTVPVQLVQQASMTTIPDWFTNVPKSEDALYSVGDGVSGSLSGALGNARANRSEEHTSELQSH